MSSRRQFRNYVDRLTIQRRTITPDRQGGAGTSVVTTAYDVAGRVETLRFETVTRFKSLGIEASHQVVIGWLPDVRTTDTILWQDSQGGNRLLRIANINDVDNIQRQMLILCKEDKSIDAV